MFQGTLRKSLVAKFRMKLYQKRTRAHTCSHRSDELGAEMSVWRESTYVRVLILEVSCSDTFFRTQEIGVLGKESRPVKFYSITWRYTPISSLENSKD